MSFSWGVVGPGGNIQDVSINDAATAQDAASLVRQDQRKQEAVQGQFNSQEDADEAYNKLLDIAKKIQVARQQNDLKTANALAAGLPSIFGIPRFDDVFSDIQSDLYRVQKNQVR